MTFKRFLAQIAKLEYQKNLILKGGRGSKNLKNSFSVDIAKEKIKGSWKINVADISSRNAEKLTL